MAYFFCTEAATPEGTGLIVEAANKTSAAVAYVRAIEPERASCTIWMRIMVVPTSDGYAAGSFVTVAVDPVAPPCRAAKHEWGPISNGNRCCKHCSTVMVIDENAVDPATGANGMVLKSYC
jgi:hypothetical protein